MTETTAKSGAAGAPTTPVAEETAADNSGTPATGRAAVGRAAVPAEAASPKFTRAPGMNPPPEQPADGASAASAATTPGSGAAGSSRPSGSGVSPSGVSSGPGSPVAVAAPPATGKAQVSAPPAGPATAPGRPGAAGTAAAAGRAAAGTSSVRTVGAPGAPGMVVGAAGAAAVGNARVNEAVRAARTSVTSGSGRGPRRARLNLKRIDPWSVMKFSFAVSLVLFIVVIVATSVLYLALDAMDVFQTVNTSLGDLISAGGGTEASTFKITAKGVIGTSALIGLVNVVLFTALATLGAFIYNVCADLVGGVELTLAERD